MGLNEVSNRSLPATHPAVQEKRIVRRIVEAANPEDLAALKGVSPLFNEAVKCPAMSTRQLASGADHSGCATSAASSSSPKQSGGLSRSPHDLKDPSAQAPRSARTGRGRDYLADPQNHDRLLQIIFNKPFAVMPGGNPYDTALEPQRGVYDFDHPLREAYAFLLKRGYNRAHQSGNFNGRSVASGCLVALLIGLEVAAFRSLPKADDEAGLSQRLWASSWLVAVTAALWLCGRDTVRYFRVNNCADDIYEHGLRSRKSAQNGPRQQED